LASVISRGASNVGQACSCRYREVTARADRGELRVEVRDDGVGGARGGYGTGLGGIEDRGSALDGRFVLASPPGGGTRVFALLPIPDPG
jgi:signal transduction histidine kinase